MSTITNAPVETPFETTISSGQNATVYMELYEILGQRVRVSIRSDAYKEQCYARAEVWDISRKAWNQIHYVHPSKMATPEKLVYHPNKTGENPKHFEKDVKALKRAVLFVLGGSKAVA